MIKTSQLHTNGMDFFYVFGEIIEVIEEIKKRNIIGVIDELCDVWTCILCAFYETTKIDVPVIWEKSAKSWLKRFDAWEIIFALNNLEYHPHYLKNGGNYKKIHKVVLALNMGYKEQRCKQ